MKNKIVSILSHIFPGAITKFAYDKLTNPQVRKLRDNELEILNQAETEDFTFEEFKIKTYAWGEVGEEVFLIHGWEGQAGNFSDIIIKLLRSGYKVRAFDGPSHGYSSRGETSLLKFSELIGILLIKYRIRTLVSHSFGGVATTFALKNNPEIEIDKYVLLTRPDRFLERIDHVMQQNGISKKVKNRLIKKLEEENNFSVESLNVSDFVKEIKVKKSLIIHDKEDKVIPISQSRNVHKNWRNSTLMEVEGTGHFRILRTEAVLQKIMEFIR